MVDLRRLGYFVVVADQLHFGRAAVQLFIAQPSLSVQIRKLEQELGTALFVRGRTVELTAAGRALVPRARQILAEAHALPAFVRSVAADDAGIHLSYVPYARRSALTPILDRYRQHYPDVRIVLDAASDSPSVFERLCDGSADAGLLRARAPAEWLRQLPVTSEPFLVALPRGHPLSAQVQVRLAELSGQLFAMFGPDVNEAAYRDLMTFFAKAGYTPRIGHRSKRMDESLAFVASGGGVALFPRSVSEMTDDPHVEFRPVVDPTPTVDIVLAWDVNSRNPRLIDLIELTSTHDQR